MGQVVGGHALELQCRGDIQRHAVGNPHQFPRRDGGVFGVAADFQAIGDRIADGDIIDAGSDGLDRAGASHPRRERRLVGIGVELLEHAAPHVDIDEIDPGVGDFDQRLALARFRGIDIAQHQGLRSAVFGNPYCFHDPSLSFNAPPTSDGVANTVTPAACSAFCFDS